MHSLRVTLELALGLERYSAGFTAERRTSWSGLLHVNPAMSHQFSF
jgi:hypothetical protein